VAFAITFFFISPGSSFFSSPNRITNVWHSDLVRNEYIVPRSLPVSRFVPSFGPIINRRVSPLPLYAPVVRPYFVPVPVVAAAEAPTLPPPTTTEAVTTTTAAATTLPPPPPPTTTAAPVEVETEAPAAIEEAPAPPAIEEAPAAPPAAPVAPQVITIQQPAAQGGFPQGIIAVQPIITHGGFLNIGNGGVSAPGGISQFSALLHALMAQQAAPAAPVMTEAPAPATTLAPAPETTAAPTLPPTTLAPPTPVHYIPALPNIVLQPPQQVFQHQVFNQIPAAQQAPLPEISPVDDQKFLIKVEDAHANQEKRNLRYNGQNEYGYSVSHSHGQGGQSYSSYAQNNAVAPGSAYYGQQQLHPAQGPAETQQVYSNQVHVSYSLAFILNIGERRQLAKLW
jgi:hypothetical protein